MAEAKRINRSVYGQYGLTQLDGYEVPYLSAAQAERLANPGEKWMDASFGNASQIADLGWSGNSASNALARGAAAFGLEKTAISPPATNTEFEPSFNFINQGYTGIPTEPAFGYEIRGDLQGLAKQFNIDASKLTPYEKEITGDIYGVTGEANAPQVVGKGVIKVPVRDSEGQIREYQPLKRTVSVEEQLYDKINEATKDYFAYTGDTLVPGQASEGGPRSFQTVLYKKEGDVLKPISKPVEHSGWQNPDVYRGGSGFSLSELVRGIAPVAALAVGGPLLDAALAAGTAASTAGGSIGGISLGGAFTPVAGSGASFTLPAAAAAGAGGSIGGINLGGAFTPTAGSGASFSAPGLLGTSSLSVTPEVTSALNTANTTLPTIPGSVPYAPSSFGTLTPPLTGSGAVPGAMSTAIPGTGLTGALPSGVLVGDGTLGTTLGATYMSAGPGQFAVNALGNAIPASSVGIGGFAPASGLSIGIKDALNVARLGSGLLGGQQQPTQQAAATKPQSIIPRGQVDYSGILNLLQVPSPQRNMYSLLG